MIEITESAGSKIKELLTSQENPALFLRVGVQGGGCSGLTYGMGFDEEQKETDQEFELHGIKVVVDEDSLKLLKGTRIDYKESMVGGGFTIDNPNAIATCGCGTSFKTATEEGTPEKCE
ncbi:iron-sulfur cluster insertion protein ErpA [Ammoniphilus sp. YIM 78166]|uniref:iron-sulfur cluster insertion protein ErpA n=1 Tax=Ammoniphilus sp. YIM 78166 TaxID=1644106 RepID=UPI00106F64EB|nr:iron-sulfur cluster insertion protein ErpA [Ammoniphilus sp. YIM 78166]